MNYYSIHSRTKSFEEELVELLKNRRPGIDLTHCNLSQLRWEERVYLRQFAWELHLQAKKTLSKSEDCYLIDLSYIDVIRLLKI